MTIYQELQLNQSGSKALLKNTTDKKEKFRHLAVYLFKIFITMVFCMAFVIAYTAVFGGLLINALCIEALMLLSCHNVLMANHSTLVLGYLLLYGYDVSGETFVTRIGAMAFGALLTGIVFYRNHCRKEYKRDFWHLFREFDLHSSRTRWQLTMALGVSSIIFFMELFDLPRAMWAGIATMSILVPFPADAKKRLKGRIPGAIFYRLFHNACGALYGLLFGRIFQTSVSKLTDRWEA